EAVAGVEGVGNEIGLAGRVADNAVIDDERAGRIGQRLIQRVGIAEREAAELDVGVLDGRATIAADCGRAVSGAVAVNVDANRAGLLVEADFHVGAQRAEFGLGAGVQVEVGAGQPGIGVVVEQAGAAV